MHRTVVRVCRMCAKTAKNAGWRWCARRKIEKAEHLGNVRLVTYSDILKELVPET